MRYCGRSKCSLSFAANTYNGTMGPYRVYQSFTKIISNESTDLSIQWNVVSFIVNDFSIRIWLEKEMRKVKRTIVTVRTHKQNTYNVKNYSRI